MFNEFWTSNFDLYWSLALQILCIRVRLLEGKHFLQHIVISFSKKMNFCSILCKSVSSYFSLTKVLGRETSQDGDKHKDQNKIR